MITSEVKANFSISGLVKITIAADITAHQSREMLDALGSVLSETWIDGTTSRTDKEKISLARKPKDELEQEEIPLDYEHKQVIEPPYVVIDTPLIPGQEQAKLIAPIEDIADAASEEVL